MEEVTIVVPGNPDDRGEKIAIHITIETDNGKISGQICEKCAIAISEKLESAIEKGIERRRREAARGNL